MPKKASCRCSPKKKTLSKKTMKKKSPKKSPKKSKKSRRPKTELLSYHPGQYYLPNKYTGHGRTECREIGGIPRKAFTTSRGTRVKATCVAPKGQRVLSEPSPCYGKLKRDCSADDGCHWTKRFENRFGTVAGHCGLIPGYASRVGSASSTTSSITSPASSYTTVSGSSTPSSTPRVPQYARPGYRIPTSTSPKYSPMSEEEKLAEDMAAGLIPEDKARELAAARAVERQAAADAALAAAAAEPAVMPSFRFHGGHRRMY